jgi:hypothetical protein
MRPTKAAGQAHNRGGGGGEGAERAQARSYQKGQTAHYYVCMLISSELEYSSAAQFNPILLMILEDGPSGPI